MATCNNPGATKVFGHPMPSSLAELKKYKQEIEAGLAAVRVRFRKTPNGPLQNGTINIQRKLAPDLQAALDEIAADPGVAFNFGGSYCFRGMNNGKSDPPASIHSLGLAIDVNVPQNPYRHDNAKDDAFHMRSDNHTIVKAFKKRGWTWGGDWNTPDYMHFEYSSGAGELDGSAISNWESIINSGDFSQFGSNPIGGGYRIGECPEDIKFKRLWKMYREKLGGSGGSGAGMNFGSGPINLNMNAVGISQGMLEAICMLETGKQWGHTMSSSELKGVDIGDAGGHKTYGYGSLFDAVSGKYLDQIKPVWTQEELEQQYIAAISRCVNAVKSKLPANASQDQIDAIVSACYNFGNGFITKFPIGKKIRLNANDPTIYNDWVHLSDKQGVKYPGLIRRRKFEADWYMGNHHSPS